MIEPKKLKNRYRDVENLERWMVYLYQIASILYLQTKDPVSKLRANGIHTWIAVKQPTWETLKNNMYRAHDVFILLCEVDLCSGAAPPHGADQIELELCKNQMMFQLSTMFGWKKEIECWWLLE